MSVSSRLIDNRKYQPLVKGSGSVGPFRPPITPFFSSFFSKTSCTPPPAFMMVKLKSRETNSRKDLNDWRLPALYSSVSWRTLPRSLARLGGGVAKDRIVFWEQVC